MGRHLGSPHLRGRGTVEEASVENLEMVFVRPVDDVWNGNCDGAMGGPRGQKWREKCGTAGGKAVRDEMGNGRREEREGRERGRTKGREGTHSSMGNSRQRAQIAEKTRLGKFISTLHSWNQRGLGN